MSIDTIRLNEANKSVGLDNPALAVGVGNVADWNDAPLFLDLMKQSRGWFDAVDGVYYWFDELKAMGYFEDALDAQGWPTYIPEHINQFWTVWAWDKAGDYVEEIAAERSGVYVLRYEGQGEISVSGGAHINIISSQAGEIVFENTTGETFYLAISATDPNQTGDYIKNVSIVKEEYLELYDAGSIFNPDFINAYADLRELRFMDLLETNHSKLSELADRPMVDDLTYKGGVPIEIVVELANQTGTDIWINIPHLATDEYIAFVADYIQAHLDPNLKVTVEYSNEAWNGMFTQAQDMQQLGATVFDQAEEYSAFETGLSYYGMRASQVMQIFSEAFAKEDSPHLVRVLASLTGGEWITQQALLAPVWAASDSEAYSPPYQFFDAIAVTTYFGGEIIINDDSLQILHASIEDESVDENAVLAAMLRDPEVPSSLPNLALGLTAHANLADQYLLDLLSYEGGQHIHHLAGTNGEGLVVEDFLQDFVRSEEMAELYEEIIELWEEYGDGPFMHYGWVGAPNQYGSWAALATYEDTNPRATVLLDYNQPASVTWESRAGVHFQQGVTLFGDEKDEILTGTLQEDFLLGGAGNDLLIGGAGDDGLNGGQGDDEALFSGTREDYDITPEGDGYRADGLDGSDFLINIEWLSFENGDQFELATMTHANFSLTNQTLEEGDRQFALNDQALMSSYEVYSPDTYTEATLDNFQSTEVVDWNLFGI